MAKTIGTLIDPKKKEKILKRIHEGKAPLFMEKKPEPEQPQAPPVATEGTLEEKLRVAILNSNIDEMIGLIRDGAKVNAVDTNGYTLLMNATLNRKAEVAKILLESGANVNGRNNADMTALMFAACQGWVDIASLLMQWGADINAKDNMGRSALLHVVINLSKIPEKDQKAMVEYLCRQPGIQDWVDNDNKCANDYASPEINKILEDFGIIDTPF